MVYAGDVWFFVIAMLWLIAGVCIYYATGGDEEDRKKDYIFDPARHSSKFVAPRSLNVAKTLTKNKED